MTSVMFTHWISSMLLLFETNSLGIRGEHRCAPEKQVELTMADDMLGPSYLAELQTLFSSCVDGGCKIETTTYSTYDFSGDYCNYHPNVCQHNGTCLNNDTKPYYTCNCTDGYYGRNCSQKYCEHHPNACQHNGICLNNNTNPYHTCDCTDGYYGKNCSENYCEHHPNVCQHNGTCLNNDTQPYYTCNCTDGYYGKNCSENYCEHHPNVCQPNGTCLSKATPPYYSCNCTEGYYGKNCSRLVRSCEDAQSALARNDSGGVFKLDLPEVGITNVFCDLTDDGGVWTVFQRRMSEDVDFYRGWEDYVKGFGGLQGDHWLGLETLHLLTKTGNMEMKIKMITENGVYWVAKYSSFRVGPESNNYKLHVSGFSGNATCDGLSYNNNQQFSTEDDHDGASRNCASLFEAGWWYGACFDDDDGSHSSGNCGGWWYGNCARSNLNGNFHKTGKEGIWWSSYYLRFSEMKFRKRLSLTFVDL